MPAADSPRSSHRTPAPRHEVGRSHRFRSHVPPDTPSDVRSSRRRAIPCAGRRRAARRPQAAHSGGHPMTDPEVDQFIDRPEESASADVTVISRGVTLTAHVEVSDTFVVVVRLTGGGPAGADEEIQLGDAVELYWVGGQEERTLAGTVSQIEGGAEARWHVAVSGQAERSQRRKAVRARVDVPVIIPWAGSQMMGKTVDLSEGGMRALMDGWG